MPNTTANIAPSATSSIFRLLHYRWVHLLAIAVVYAALLLPTAGRQGISWDEQTDIQIARAYLASPGGWLHGSPIDPSQTRLPMFIVGLVYLLLDTTDLLTARLASCAVGLLTLAGVYVFCRQRFDHARGILATALLATSPFFLSFARVAFTETDIYLACAFAWLLVSMARFQDHPSTCQAALVGITYGLALSSKATALGILPAVWFCTIWPAVHKALLRHGLLLVSLATGVALLTFFLIPIEHLANPLILRSLIYRLRMQITFSPAFIVEASTLHIFSILFKSGPITGCWLILSAIFAVRQWRRLEMRFPLLLVGTYFCTLAILPIAQTFYSVPLLPVLSIFAADLFWRLFHWKRIAAVGLATLATIMLVIDLALCYPDYNLNGYQWLGARMLAGRSTIGYRSVVQTPSDGVQQALEWLNTHARQGETVQAFLLDWDIVQAVAPNPVYQVVNGFSGPAQTDADYVAVEINAQIPQSWWTTPNQGRIFSPPYDPSWLESCYVKVFSVRRAFGIEMASVWKKR